MLEPTLSTQAVLRLVGDVSLVFPIPSKKRPIPAAMSAATKNPPPSPTKCVGPDYRPEQQKPTATVSTPVSFENVHTLPQTPQLIALLTWVTDIRPNKMPSNGMLILIFS